MAEGKPKLGQRLIRAAFVGAPVGSLLFMVFYMTAQTINGIGGATVMDPLYAGTFGLTIGMSAALGIEFSKDLE